MADFSPDIAKAILPEQTKAEQLRVIDICCQAEHDLLRAMGAPVYDGLEETLKELNKRYPLFVVSNCQAGYIELVFEKTGLGKYFTGHLCPGDSGEAKAANIRSIAKKYQLKAPVYVGDTFWRLPGMSGGRGTICICFLWIRTGRYTGLCD